MALSKVQEVAEGYIGPVGGQLVWRVFEVTGPASYTSGGETLSASDLKVSKVLFAQVAPKGDAVLGGHWWYDYANSKLRAVYDNHTHTENTAGAYTQNASTAGPAGVGAAERAAATNFTTSVLRVFVIGLAP